jgi:hypothetical protein
MTCEKNWKLPYNLKGYIDCRVAKRVVDPSIMTFPKSYSELSAWTFGKGLKRHRQDKRRNNI